jgi:hypothetical protein
MVDADMSSRDIYQSAWGQNFLCFYRKRLYDDSLQSEIQYEGTSNGPFFARMLSPNTAEKQMIDNIFQFDSKDTTLVTRDDITDLQPADLVTFRNEDYIVASIQSKPRQMNSEFDNAPSTETYLSIRGR